MPCVITEQAQLSSDAVQHKCEDRRWDLQKQLIDRTQIPLDFFFPSLLEQDWSKIFVHHSIWSTAANEASSWINGTTHTQSTSHPMPGWMSMMDGMIPSVSAFPSLLVSEESQAN